VQFLGSTHMGNDEVKKTIKDWFNAMAAGIQKLFTRYDKCPTLNGDYAEKLFEVCIDNVKQFFLHLFLCFCNHQTVFTLWMTYIYIQPHICSIYSIGKYSFCQNMPKALFQKKSLFVITGILHEQNKTIPNIKTYIK
jgi:hypothetical protein